MKIGFTLGDPAGIGPEIILKAIPKIPNREKILIFGNKQILKKTAADLGILKNYRTIENNIVECTKGIRFQYGKPTVQTGEVALTSIAHALKENLDVMITPPIVKEVIRMKHPGFIGHTEFLARFFKVPEFAMVGVAGKKVIMLLTTHLPLRDIFKKIKPQVIKRKIVFLNWGLKRYFRVTNPHIGVSALNPHAFEFSRGEDEKIKRGIDLARKQGINVHGPYPADSLFNQGFDGYLAMFHDQAMIFLKSQRNGLNLTMGLPMIRLSPLYGAALDIAGKNQARYSGLIAAVHTGVILLRNTQRFCGKGLYDEK